MSLNHVERSEALRSANLPCLLVRCARIFFHLLGSCLGHSRHINARNLAEHRRIERKRVLDHLFDARSRHWRQRVHVRSQRLLLTGHAPDQVLNLIIERRAHGAVVVRRIFYDHWHILEGRNRKILFSLGLAQDLDFSAHRLPLFVRIGRRLRRVRRFGRAIPTISWWLVRAIFTLLNRLSIILFHEALRAG